MKYSGIFDTHAHYDDEQFDFDQEELLNSIKDSGVSFVINCGCDVQSSRKAIELAEKFDFVFAAVGIHPHEAGETSESDFEIIEQLLSHKKAVAVGEIGLDYHYDFTPRENQTEAFERQILLAKKLKKPIIVHDREAHADTLELLKRHKPQGVVHCFSSGKETAKEITELGMYIGLGGAVTFKNARRPLEVAEAVPKDRLLLETDCPYMAPVPMRGKRCDSEMIAYTAERIAAVRGEDVQELIDSCCENAKTLFFAK